MQYLHIQIGLCTKGSFHESGQCNYINILNYNFSLRLLCEYFMIRIMKVLFKCCNMDNVLTLLDEGIAHLVYSTNEIHSWWMGVLCATWHKMIPKSTNLNTIGQNLNKWIDTKMFK